MRKFLRGIGIWLLLVAVLPLQANAERMLVPVGKVIGLQLRSETSGEESKIAVDGAFLAVGLMPENEAFAHLAQLNSWGYFDSPEDCCTKTPGVFVAGDCRSKAIRQVVTAAGDGAVAAMAACRYLDR